MNRTLLLALLLALPALATPGCGNVRDFYEKDYVLYDGREQDEEDTAEQDAAAADSETAAAVAASAEITTDADPARIESEQDQLARVFELESHLAELDRALEDGIGDADALEQKRSDIAREIAWRREELGEAYQLARQKRIEQILQIRVVVR